MSKGRAALAISQGMSVWVLEARDGFGDADFHAHHAIQITASLAGNLRLVGDKETVSGQVLAVKAGERHRLEADGMLAFVFIEPECRQGKALTHLLFKGAEIVSLDPEIAAMLLPLANAFDGGRTAWRCWKSGSVRSNFSNQRLRSTRRTLGFVGS